MTGISRGSLTTGDPGRIGVGSLADPLPEKSKRAVRRHHMRRVAAARRRFLAHFRSYDDVREKRSDNELATRHPMDCGARCFLCHAEKLLGAGSRRAREKREAMRDA